VWRISWPVDGLSRIASDPVAIPTIGATGSRVLPITTGTVSDDFVTGPWVSGFDGFVPFLRLTTGTVSADLVTEPWVPGFDGSAPFLRGLFGPGERQFASLVCADRTSSSRPSSVMWSWVSL